mgnify:FL=1
MDALGDAVQPAAGHDPGAADTVVLDADPQAGLRGAGLADAPLDAAPGGPGMLGGVGQGLGDEVVGGGLRFAVSGAGCGAFFVRPDGVV